MDISDPKTEEDWITESHQRIRGKQKILEKKYPFGLRWTYWDADELLFHMREERLESIEISRKDGPILITARLDWNHPEKLTLRPDHLIDLFCSSPEQIRVILMTYKEMGTFQMSGLTAPGLDEMKKFCKEMDKEIIEIAQELKKKRIPKCFEKICIKMTGNDLVARRMQYYRNMVYQYSMDQNRWTDEMRRLGLLR